MWRQSLGLASGVVGMFWGSEKVVARRGRVDEVW